MVDYEIITTKGIYREELINGGLSECKICVFQTNIFLNSWNTYTICVSTLLVISRYPVSSVKALVADGE